MTITTRTPAVASRRNPRPRGAAIMVVLAALALLSPLLHCDLVPAAAAHARAHEAVTAAGHHERTGDPAGSHCTAHAVHCVSQVVLPARVPDPFALVLLVTLTLVATVALSFAPTAGRWIRGPPAGALAAGGREILTRFCIARR
ncbi:putative copper homeostasis (lipo)protein LpqS [Nocardia testacea]|uniref:Lipoprotein LpqS n=1 Tax=Nocardia testacea TaxID=248551 RepID=A0ABW7W297_9NOCA